MGLNDVHIASAFGALDVDAITDGRAVDAAVLRVMEEQANRLLSKPMQLLNLVWPETQQTINDADQHGAEWAARLFRAPTIPPIFVPKLPQQTAATLYVRALIDNGGTIRFHVTTRAGEAVLDCLGTGSFAYYSVTIPLEPRGTLEQVLIEHRSLGDGGLMDTGTYGAPATATLNSNDEWQGEYMEDADSNWTQPPNSMASAGHYVELFDNVTDEVLLQQAITHVDGTKLYYEYPVGFYGGWGQGSTPWSFGGRPEQVGLIRSAYFDGRLDYAIRKIGTLALAQILIVSQART